MWWKVNCLAIPSVQNASLPFSLVSPVGEHTDYNEGFVFPLALDLRTFVVGRGSLLVRPPNQKVPLTPSRITSESQQGIVSFVADKVG